LLLARAVAISCRRWLARHRGARLRADHRRDAIACVAPDPMLVANSRIEAARRTLAKFLGVPLGSLPRRCDRAARRPARELRPTSSASRCC
jgi:hypothetical protein